MPAGTGPVVSPATGSIHDRCIQDLALMFQALNLKGSTQAAGIGEHVYAKSLADDLSDVELPAVLVTTEGGEEMLDAENFEERSWGYPCAVLLIENASPLDPNIRGDFLQWRHDLMVKVDELPLSSARPFLPKTPECWNLSLRPKSVFEEWQRVGQSGLPAFMLLASSFVVLCHCNEARIRG